MSETTEPTTGVGSDGAIIKADRHGRARYDAAFRRRVLEAYASSGMSAMAFAGHCGVKYSTLAAWVRRARDGGGAESSQVGQGAPRFLVAEVAGAGEPRRPSDGAVELEIAPGMVARANDAKGVALLAALVRQLCQQEGTRSC